MKYSYALLLTAGSFLSASGQSLVTFQMLPRHLQLFPRNATSQATVVAEGTVTDASATRLTMHLHRAGRLSQVQQQTLPASRAFRFAPVIRAELAEYTLRLYLHRQPGDSVLVAERNRLVCGDMFLIYGQSNAFGLENLERITVNDQFMRQCGPIYGQDFATSTQWFSALNPYGSVGAFGLYMAEAIQKTTQIPIGFINGAEGGAAIGQLSDRNAANPADLNTIYGRMLYRAQWAGVQGQFRAIFYKQGEAEAGSSPLNYAANFDRLYQLLRQDYGNVPRFYVSQINILTTGSPEAGTLRDFQRRLPDLYPRQVSNIATVGSAGYDGLHYDLPGSRQIGYEQARLVLRDLYADADTNQIDSPNVRQVYQNGQNDTLTVVFEPTMQMVWPADSTVTKKGQTLTRRLLDVLLADGQPDRFTAGRAEGNRVYLTLKQPGAVQTLTYFPPFVGDGPAGFYDGPTLKNSRGMRAFTFDRFPVARALPAITTLTVTRTSHQEIDLTWTIGSTATDATALVLERSGNRRISFVSVARLALTATGYTDAPTGSGPGPYAYRLRVVGQRAESGPGNVVEARLLPICSLTATVSGSTVVVYGGTLSLSAGAAGAEATPLPTYLWRAPDGATATTPALTRQGLTPVLSGLYSVTVTQGSCTASASASVTVQAPLALEPPPTGLTVWPNPVRAGQPVQVNVPDTRWGEIIFLRLIDIHGRVVFRQDVRQPVSGPVTVRPQPLPTGMYILEGRTETARLRRHRLLVE